MTLISTNISAEYGNWADRRRQQRIGWDLLRILPCQLRLVVQLGDTVKPMAVDISGWDGTEGGLDGIIPFICNSTL